MEGIERIKALAADVEDADLLKVIDYLLTREDMDEKYLNEEKSLKQMVEFINSEAKEKISEKAKSGFNGYYFSDETVYGWAIHYWDEPNENLGLTPKSKKTTVKEELTEDEEELEETEEKTVPKIEKIEPKKKSTKKEWISEGQLSLFDVM